MCRYVDSPLLFRGKKFHFRCYTVMMADGTAMVYRKAFILSAGLDFDYNDDDVRKHVTNLSVNKKFAGHPGQVPCNLLEEYPQVCCDEVPNTEHSSSVLYAISGTSPIQWNLFN